MKFLIICAAAFSIGAAQADDTVAAGLAAVLHAKYTAFKYRQVVSSLPGQLALASSEGASGIAGEILALVDYPFEVAGPALDQSSEWCEILMLHLNTKGCRPDIGPQGAVLHVSIGKKFDQAVSDAYLVDFTYRVVAQSESYLQVNLNAAEGPLGTRDYRIVVEAAPADTRHTFIRLSYSYSYGMVGRLAMQGYLATVGRDKVGFTAIDGHAGGEPHYIGGTRGVVERNTMRYYLAIESYLGSLSAPGPERREKSLRDWFAAIERFPRQLHEMGEGEYLAMKRNEYSRQETGIR